MSYSRSTGTASDGYVDDVSLVLTLAPGSTGADTSCAAVLNPDYTMDIDRFELFGSGVAVLALVAAEKNMVLIVTHAGSPG